MSAADIAEVGCPEPALVLQRMASTRSCCPSSRMNLNELMRYRSPDALAAAHALKPSVAAGAPSGWPPRQHLSSAVEGNHQRADADRDQCGRIDAGRRHQREAEHAATVTVCAVTSPSPGIPAVLRRSGTPTPSSFSFNRQGEFRGGAPGHLGVAMS